MSISASVRLVLIIDPVKRTLIAASSGDVIQGDAGNPIVEPPQAPGLTLDLHAIFAQLDAP